MIPRGEFVTIDGPAYLTPLETPEMTVEVGRAFWARVDAQTRS